MPQYRVGVKGNESMSAALATLTSAALEEKTD
jgi:hypothetical protein